MNGCVEDPRYTSCETSPESRGKLASSMTYGLDLALAFGAAGTGNGSQFPAEVFTLPVNQAMAILLGRDSSEARKKDLARYHRQRTVTSS